MDDKIEGKAKEAFGALTGDEAKKEEGRAQQRKAKAQEEAAQRAKTRQAEEEDQGLLGGVTDNLGKRDRGSRT